MLNFYYKAIEMFDKAIELGYNEYALFHSKGNICKILGREEDSEKMFSKASELYNQEGNKFYNLSQYDKAIDYYNIGISIYNKHSYLYCNKGNSLFNLKKYHEALQLYDMALKLNPKDYSYYFQKGITFKKLNKIKCSILYLFTSNLIKGKKEFFNFKYRNEINKIKRFESQNDYEGLRLYLLSLEEKEEN